MAATKTTNYVTPLNTFLSTNSLSETQAGIIFGYDPIMTPGPQNLIIQTTKLCKHLSVFLGIGVTKTFYRLVIKIIGIIINSGTQTIVVALLDIY